MKTPQENNKTWEEEFDSRFTAEWWYGFGTSDDINKKGIEGIKAFISQALDTQRKEIVEKITELKIPQEKYKLSNIHLCEERNTFIEDILKLIENK